MAKILIVDIETAPMEVASFSLYPESIGYNFILKDEFIICACWKELGSKTINSVKITKAGDDKKLLKDLREVLSEADIVIGHNFEAFDLRKINSRFIRHNIAPLPGIPVVDTLKELKKVAKFPSHRLDYLAKELLGEGKMETSKDLWLKAMRGDKRSIDQMVRYCKVDVAKTESIYLKFRPYFNSHPAMGVMLGHERGVSCNKCGSTHMKKNGVRLTATGLQRYELQCQDCGSYQRVAISIIQPKRNAGPKRRVA